jgi:alpha-2-macroglobulin
MKKKSSWKVLVAATLTAGILVTQLTRAAFDSAAPIPKGDVQIVRVTPFGKDVPVGRQIVVTFDRPMKPLGDMAVASEQTPVLITPAIACNWHWLDPRSLACELPSEHPLLPAMTYTLTVREGVQAEDGNVLREAFHAQFSTERPVIKEYMFYSWRGPGTPVIQLVFNQPVSRDSVAANVRFTGQQRSTVQPVPFDNQPAYRVFPLPGEKAALVLPTQPVPPPLPGETDVARHTWLVSPAQELPADTRAQLSVEPGVRGYAGPLLGTEQRTVVQFDTFPEFRFLGVRCRAPARQVMLSPEHPDPAVRCNPLSHVSLVFSSPVIPLEIRDHLNLSPDLAGGRTDYDPWENVYPTSSLRAPHKRGQTYEVQLPEHLQAYKPYRLEGLEAVRDEFGRTPSGPVAMQFSTDHRTPRLRLSTSVVVLEKNAPTHMPLYVTNLTDVEVNYDRLTSSGTERQLTSDQKVARVWDIAYATPLSIRDLLGGHSGVVDGQLAPRPTPPVLDRGTYFDDDNDEIGPGNDVTTSRRFFVEVTPFSVHAKLGHYNTAVWVTSLATGLPVRDAHVRIYEDPAAGITDNPAILGEARTDGTGVALLPGREQLDPTAAKLGYDAFPYPASVRPLIVRVDAGDDIALLPLDSDFSINTYMASRGQFWSNAARRYGHVRAWGTTAQGVYKLGDTIQYKLYVRNVSNLSLAPADERTGYALQLLDPTGKVIYQVDSLDLNEFGAYSGEFRVPVSGAVGAYQFVLLNGGQRWLPMQTLVADFTPAPFHVQNTLNGSAFEPGDPVEVSTLATLHAGGPYASASSRVTARAYPDEVDFSSPVAHGSAGVASGFYFQSEQPVGNCDMTEREHESVVHQSEDKLDQKGELTTRFTLDDANIVYGHLEVESAVRDDRGKYVATRSFAGYRGRDRYVGLRSEKWSLEEGKPAAVDFLVLDKSGRVTAGVPVSFSIKAEQVTASRVKGAGNAYLTSYDKEWVDRGSCSMTSKKTPQKCVFTPSSAGLYSIQASVKDTHNRVHTTELCTWVTGMGRVLWDEPADMSLSIIPEKDTYHVGDRARYLVRNPFPGARALVTIERLGVIKSWVQVLRGNTPVIEFPIEPDYLPGFYLSVVVMSPRVAPAPGTDPIDGDGVDLGRPTYRIGYLQVNVTDPYKALDVDIKSARTSYKPGDSVSLQLRAQPRHRTGAKRERVEFAVAVLDQSVFDLIQNGKKYFDPYQGFYQLESLDVFNFGLLNRLVGLQKFEKKGANAGGDGGAGFDMRVVKNYVAYWNPSVKADPRGRAQVQFKLPDNLTGWRVFAIAVTPADHLGLGDYKFSSTKLTEIQPVMPNQVTRGDRFTAGFNVLNRSNKARSLRVTLNAAGVVEGGKQVLTQELRLEPFQRRTVWMPLVTVGEGSVRLTATAGDSKDHDGLAYTVPVHPRVSLDTAASYGTTLGDAVTESVDFPKGMLPNTGSLSLVLSPTIIGNLEGALKYVRDYEYDCWEQRLTRALMASDYLQLRDYFSADMKWPEAQTLPQSVLDDAASYQAPEGGMGFWLAQDERVSPYLSAATALAFNRLGKAGYKVPREVEKRLHAYLQRMLREKALPTFYSEGMVSSVRAVALEALAEHKEVTLADLRRYSDQVPSMDLFGKAAYLRATLQVLGAESLSAATAESILAHANQSGGKFQFTERWDDGFHQLLATPGRSQCAILQAFLEYGETPAGARLIGDVPFKLVRQITESRGSRDHWENTQENLYCLGALVDYSHDYEKDTPQLSVRASLGGQSIGNATFTAFRDPPVTLVRANSSIDAGNKAELRIERTGTGRLYYAARLSFALHDSVARATNAGIEVVREYSVQREGRWELLSSPMEIKRGELVRIDLFVDVPGARNFVVVDDPVPGGLEPVNRDLATASTVDADEGEFQAAGGSFWFKYSDWSEYGVALWSFYHRELRHDAARFYADYLPAGHYHLSYAAQAIASGEFSSSPTKAEEMYDPDVYGKSLPGQLVVHNPDGDTAKP